MRDGKTLDLKKYRGKVLAVLMVSTTCRDCAGAVDFFGKVQKEFQARGFQVIGVALGPDAPQNVGPFIDRYQPAFPMGYLDEQAARKLGDMKSDYVPTVPFVMFVDSTSTVRIQYDAKDPVFKEADKAFRSIVNSLINLRDSKAGNAKAGSAAKH